MATVEEWLGAMGDDGTCSTMTDSEKKIIAIRLSRSRQLSGRRGDPPASAAAVRP